jgi:hypothetical protein
MESFLLLAGALLFDEKSTKMLRAGHLPNPL